MRLKSKNIIRIVGLVLFAVICSRIDFAVCWGILRGTKSWGIVGAVAFGLMVIIFRTARWMKLLKGYNIHLLFTEAFLLALVGNSLGTLTPGRIGEVVKPFYLQKKGFSFQLAIKSVIFDRISDLVFIVLFGLAGLIFFDQFALFAITVAVILASGIFLSLLIKWLRRNHKDEILRKIMSLLPGELRILEEGSGTAKSWKHLLSDNWQALSLYSVAAYIGTCIKYYVLLLAIDIQMPFIVHMLTMSLVMLSRLVPISVMNLGSREAILILMFQLVGISKENALAFSMLMIVDMLLFVLIGQAVAWINFPTIRKETLRYDRATDG